MRRAACGIPLISPLKPTSPKTAVDGGRLLLRTLDATAATTLKSLEKAKADGAILYVYKYCDPFGFEVPARKAYYESINVPVLHLEDVYSAGTIGQLKTRIQAFLEMIG